MSASAYSMRSGRENKGPPPSTTDLLVCFPPRTRLALMPQKPIYSPARPDHGPPRRHSRHARKPSNRGIFAGGIGHASSPLLRAARTNSLRHNIDNISEPTSPKVSCAGQIIKVKHKPTPCSNWQSVMEEIERLHIGRKKKKSHAWAGGAFGLKKDAMQFLTCLRNIRFDFRCFGSFPASAVDDDDDDEDEEEEYYEVESENGNYRETISRRRSQSKAQTNDFSHDDDDEADHNNDGRSSNTVFSKWFMVLQEDDHLGNNESSDTAAHNVVEEEEEDCRPPPNALMLMRCRSAPLNKWLQEEKEEEREEKEKEKERLLVMTCGGDNFSKLSIDVAKETWIVGGISSSVTLSRSRSCRR